MCNNTPSAPSTASSAGGVGGFAVDGKTVASVGFEGFGIRC